MSDNAQQVSNQKNLARDASDIAGILLTFSLPEFNPSQEYSQRGSDNLGVGLDACQFSQSFDYLQIPICKANCRSLPVHFHVQILPTSEAGGFHHVPPTTQNSDAVCNHFDAEAVSSYASVVDSVTYRAAGWKPAPLYDKWAHPRVLGRSRAPRNRSGLPRFVPISLDYHTVLRAWNPQRLRTRPLSSLRLPSRPVGGQVRSTPQSPAWPVLRRVLGTQKTSSISVSPKSSGSQGRNLSREAAEAACFPGDMEQLWPTSSFVAL
jgi:hypothetical protein